MKTIIMVLIYCFVQCAEAAPQCSDLFVKEDLQTWLNDWNTQNNDVLYQGSVASHIETLPSSRQKRARKIINSFDPTSVSDRARVELTASDLLMALYGPRDVLDRYFNESADERLRNSAAFLLKEQLIRHGLKNILAQSTPDADPSFLQRTFATGYRFRQSALFSLLKLPSILPVIKDRSLSADLMQKLIRDGVDAHIEEVRQQLGLQKAIEAYNVFRRIYSATFFVAMVAFQALNQYETQQIQSEQQYLASMAKLDQLGSAAEQIRLHGRETFRHQAYEKSLQDFKQKWGEDPTPAEAQQMRDLINKRI